MSTRHRIENPPGEAIGTPGDGLDDTSPRTSRLSLRIRFRDDARLGPGKIALLEAIARSGSIAQAAQSLGMSEKRAGLLIESLTAFFGEPLTLTHATDGSVSVSALGHELIRAFRAVELDAQASFDRHFASLSARMRTPI